MGEDDAAERAHMAAIRERVRTLTKPPGTPGALTDRRRPGPKTWPECACLERCDKPKCTHAGGREIAREAAQLSVVGRKNSPERMTLLLNKVMQFPQMHHACAMAGIVYSTLRYWLVKSEKGKIGDGFDLEYAEETKRFHEHFYDARDAAVQMVEDAFWQYGMGHYEILSDKGRVMYQIDEDLVALGFTGTAAYLRGDDGKPIPERIEKQDPDVMLAVLKAWRRDKYGQHANVDVTHRGGVLVVGVRARDQKEIEQREKDYLNEALNVEFREVVDE